MVGSAEPLPPAVARVVQAYRTLIEREAALGLHGLYLVGSVALDDYRDGRSDVDFIALRDGGWDAQVLGRLAHLHAVLHQSGGPSFDGIYLDPGLLRRPAAHAVVPYTRDGELISDRACFEANPAVWRCLARSGRTLFGPDPSDLAIADDCDVLRTQQIENLRTYWTGWIRDCEVALAAKPAGADANAEALAWGVLGVARIACTLATGRIVSKSDAGRWALATASAQWHPVIRDALAARDGAVARVSLDRIRHGLAHMRLVIEEVAGYQAPETASPDGRT